MKIFELQLPVLKKIKKVIEAAPVDVIPAGQKVDYLDFEPDKGYIHESVTDGAVAVYSPMITFKSGAASGTENIASDPILRADCYGFGDPVPDDVDPEKPTPTVRQAQIRAQILVDLSIAAVMDNQENAGVKASVTPPIQEVKKWFGTDIDITNRIVRSVTKFSPLGAMESKRGSCVYRIDFVFRDLEDPAPNEPLGLPYQGTETLDSPTYNPGEEPV